MFLLNEYKTLINLHLFVSNDISLYLLVAVHKVGWIRMLDNKVDKWYVRNSSIFTSYIIVKIDSFFMFSFPHNYLSLDSRITA